MKLLKASKLVMVAAGCVGLAGLARGQGHGGGGFGPSNNPGLSHMSSHGLQHSSFGRNNAQSHVTQNDEDNPKSKRSAVKRQRRLETQRQRQRRALFRDRREALQERHDELAARRERRGSGSEFQERAQQLRERRDDLRDTTETLQERHEDRPAPKTGSHL